MRKWNNLSKWTAINRTAISHPTALPLHQLSPQTHKHMNHAEELARPQKKRADTKTKGGNDGPIPGPTKVERELRIGQCGSQRHSGFPGASDREKGAG